MVVVAPAPQNLRLVYEGSKWVMQAQDDEGWFDLYVDTKEEIAS